MVLINVNIIYRYLIFKIESGGGLGLMGFCCLEDVVRVVFLYFEFCFLYIYLLYILVFFLGMGKWLFKYFVRWVVLVFKDFFFLICM